jgi:hypothetical protein
MSISTCIRRHLPCELYLKEYINNKGSKCPPRDSMHASTLHIMHRRIRSKMPGWLQAVWQASTMRWSASSLSTGSLGVPIGTNTEYSNLESVEAVQLLRLSWKVLFIIYRAERLKYAAASACMYYIRDLNTSGTSSGSSGTSCKRKSG